jgi:thiosulfate/3-mercaptopyruvate sulfurtransferase
VRRFFFIFALALFFAYSNEAQKPTNPWNDSQTVQPADLNKELSNPQTAPVVLFVGFERLYVAGHIKGAQYHGTAANSDGLSQIKAWAESLPRTTNLVIYCGCCPLDHCPNIRPAFIALRDLGFTKLRVLILPSSFETDWANQGLPYDKSQ